MPHRLLAVVGLLLLARLSGAKETWVEVSSPNFVLVTNASERRARSLLEQAERFRHTLGQVLPQFSLVTGAATRIYGFRDAASLEPFLPRPSDEPSYVAGYFSGSGARNLLVLDLGIREHSYEKVLFHEYLHLALSLSERELPLWFEEGLSEFYAGTQLKSAQAELGAADRRHLFVLSRRELVPLEELLLVDGSSGWYRDAEKSSLFYAQSWALVHYLLVGAPRGQEQLARFLSLVSTGVDSVTAFADSFEREPAALQEELERYVETRNYRTFRIELSEMEDRGELRVKHLAMAEVQQRWGELFVANGRTVEARMCFEEACRLDPDLAVARESLGYLDLREGNLEGAKAQFERAIALDGVSAEALYRYAKLTLGEFGGHWVGTIPEEVAQTAVDVLRRSLALEPGAKGPSELLAFVYLVRGERLDEAAALVEGALASSSGDGSLLFLHAQLLAKRGQYGPARDVLSRLLESNDAALREAVTLFLSRMNSLEKAPNR